MNESVNNLQEALEILDKYMKVAQAINEANFQVQSLASNYGIRMNPMEMVEEVTLHLPYSILPKIQFNYLDGIESGFGLNTGLMACASIDDGMKEYLSDLERTLEYTMEEMLLDDEQVVEEVKQLLKELKEWN